MTGICEKTGSDILELGIVQKLVEHRHILVIRFVLVELRTPNFGVVLACDDHDVLDDLGLIDQSLSQDDASLRVRSDHGGRTVQRAIQSVSNFPGQLSERLGLLFPLFGRVDLETGGQEVPDHKKFSAEFVPDLGRNEDSVFRIESQIKITDEHVNLLSDISLTGGKWFEGVLLGLTTIHFTPRRALFAPFFPTTCLDYSTG